MDRLTKYHNHYSVILALAYTHYIDRHKANHDFNVDIAEKWAIAQVDSLTIDEVISWVDSIVNQGLHLWANYDNENRLQIGLYE